MPRGRLASALVQPGAIAAGGLLLLWPAALNAYPLLFSDTGAFLDQLLKPFMNWDKPYIYGPVLAALSLRLTLWLPVLAQGLCLSWIVWQVQSAFRAASAMWHLALCLALAIGTAAPWFASLLMPDFLAPVTVLALFLLAFDERRRWGLTVLASFAIAAHLTHLVIAACCLIAVAVLRPRGLLRSGAPLAAALTLLIASNLVGHGKLGIAPHGAVFGLARLTADGPAADYLAAACPEAGYRLCGWVGRLPTGIEQFLWAPEGPVWTYPGGPIALAPEASRIVTGTILFEPWPVARAALGNTLTQLHTVELGKVLDSDWLDVTVGSRIEAYYPAAELARYQGNLQRTGALRAMALPWQAPQAVLLALAAVASLAVAVWSWRADRRLFALTVLIAVGLLGNAFASGALSGPQDRYQARIAWLLLLPPAIRLRQFGANAVGDRARGLRHFR